MVNKILLGSLKIRNIALACAGTFTFIAYYIWTNRNVPSEEYYLFSNAKFLIFTTAFYFLLFIRITVYRSIGPSAITRIGEEKWQTAVQKAELTVLIFYFTTIFIIIPYLNGIYDSRKYLIALSLWALLWVLNYFILIYFLASPGREITGVILPVIILVIYNYLAFPLLCNLYSI